MIALTRPRMHGHQGVVFWTLVSQSLRLKDFLGPVTRVKKGMGWYPDDEHPNKPRLRPRLRLLFLEPNLVRLHTNPEVRRKVTTGALPTGQPLSAKKRSYPHTGPACIYLTLKKEGSAAGTHAAPCNNHWRLERTWRMPSQTAGAQAAKATPKTPASTRSPCSAPARSVKPELVTCLLVQTRAPTCSFNRHAQLPHASSNARCGDASPQPFGCSGNREKNSNLVELRLRR